MKTIKPDNKQELIILIENHMRCYGHTCDLNHLDISSIDDLSLLFFENRYLNQFNGDISQWNTSHVTNMSGMFEGSHFNGNISQWDTSNVTNMSFMFACSRFNGEISSWNVEKVQWMDFMFSYSMFNQSLDLWHPQQLDSLNDMFDHAMCPTPYWFIDNKFERFLLLNRQARKRQLTSTLLHSLEEKQSCSQIKL